MPSKIIKPIDSLLCISAFVLDTLQKADSLDFDELLDDLNHTYPKEISVERLQQCLDFLFIINKLGVENETYKIVLR
ncbi:ABC-three component system middle component 6 [Vibrio tubiashii]